MRRSKSEAVKNVSFSQLINKKKVVVRKTNRVLDEVNERRVNNFGGGKKDLDNVKKWKLIQNYQQSYSQKRENNDSLLNINGKKMDLFGIL